MDGNLYPPIVGFRSRKAAQITAYFGSLAHGTIEKLKLIKLIYLAERECISRHGRPMLFDEFYSLPHGPICSATLNGIDGLGDEGIWDRYVARNGNIIVPVKKMDRDDLDEVSNVEFNVIMDTWERFGGRTSSQLRNYTHDNCPEYVEVPIGSRLPISYKDVFEAVGIDDAEEQAEELEEFRRIESRLN